MIGIQAAAGYVPHHRLRREAISAVLGGSPASGTRAVAGYDEDATTMAVAAARLALRGAPDGVAAPHALWLSSATAPYVDKTNATIAHAALRLDREALAADFGGAPRSAIAALLAALRSTGSTLVVASDVRAGLPGSEDESSLGDGAAALLVGGDGPVLAEVLAAASATEEFLDRWREPGEVRTKAWEERFSETKYAPLAADVVKRALGEAGIEAADRVIVTGQHARAAKGLARRLGEAVVDDRTRTVGNTGTAHPLLLLADTLEQVAPGETILLVSLADGADAVVLRATDEIATWQPARTVAAQIAAGDDRLAYADYLAWRGVMRKEPPRRPEPARASASAAGRNTDWKFGFVGSRDRTTGALHLPPARVSFQGGAVDEMDPAPMADVEATVATFTIDRLAWSPSPPTVFAVLDFDGGGRLACEVTDVDETALAIGDRVEMTFRLVSVADGIRNYFWKARPVLDAAQEA